MAAAAKAIGYPLPSGRSVPAVGLALEPEGIVCRDRRGLCRVLSGLSEVSGLSGLSGSLALVRAGQAVRIVSGVRTGFVPRRIWG